MISGPRWNLFFLDQNTETSSSSNATILEDRLRIRINESRKDKAKIEGESIKIAGYTQINPSIVLSKRDSSIN